MICFKRYHLYLTEDKRDPEREYFPSYHKFIGKVGCKKAFYRYKVLLGDEWSKNYRYERVWLKVLKIKERNIIVEAQNVLL